MVIVYSYFTGTYTIICMAITSAAMFVTVFILAVFNKNPEKEVPSWANKLIMQGIGTVVCLKPKVLGTNIVQPASHTQKIGVVEDLEYSEKPSDILSKQEKLPSSPVPEIMVKYYSLMLEKEAENDWIEKNRNDWQRMSRIMDRFFLLLFLLVFIICSTVFMAMVVYS